MKPHFVPDPRFVACEERGSVVMVKELRIGERAFMSNGGAFVLLRRNVPGQFVTVRIESTSVELKLYEETVVVPEKHWPA